MEWMFTDAYWEAFAKVPPPSTVKPLGRGLQVEVAPYVQYCAPCAQT